MQQGVNFQECVDVPRERKRTESDVIDKKQTNRVFPELNRPTRCGRRDKTQQQQKTHNSTVDAAATKKDKRSKTGQGVSTRGHITRGFCVLRRQVLVHLDIAVVGRDWFKTSQ